MSFIKLLIKKVLGRNQVIYTNLPRLKITSGTLKKFFQAADLRILDVGARGGPFSEWAPLAPFTHLFVCEPDKEEAERINNDLLSQGSWNKVTIIPAAFGLSGREAILNITRYPGLSSLFEPNHALIAEYFPSHQNFKKESREAWEISEKRSVPLISLDSAAEKYGCQDLSLLKLDTQGSELDILKSGAMKVIPSTVAIYIEGEFTALYKNQPLFSEVSSFLEKHGFRLIDLKRTFLRRDFKQANPIFSKPEILYSHALFVREKKHGNGELDIKSKIKLVCIMTASWYFDYAIKILRDESVQKFLLDNGYGAIDKEILSYSKKVWNSLPYSCRKKYKQSSYQDKTREI